MAMSGASLVMRHAGNGVVQATFYVVLTQAMKKLIIYGSEKSCFRSRNLWTNKLKRVTQIINQSDKDCQSLVGWSQSAVGLGIP